MDKNSVLEWFTVVGESPSHSGGVNSLAQPVKMDFLFSGFQEVKSTRWKAVRRLG
jgi:hypothetical protein